MFLALELVYSVYFDHISQYGVCDSNFDNLISNQSHGLFVDIFVESEVLCLRHNHLFTNSVVDNHHADFNFLILLFKHLSNFDFFLQVPFSVQKVILL